ncbi:hypothetical protein DICVIV_09676 [Dictyocaulus viviparus]|uniref:Uncharacterized protein n=1 Tax=Dictyocaulus viviparus TaxID=29172 RepID=A0A0D8XKF2_DICVI|nr:hypothetical protein DICVIV_09676 [Dictyocaulus viviparus]
MSVKMRFVLRHAFVEPSSTGASATFPFNNEFKFFNITCRHTLFVDFQIHEGHCGDGQRACMSSLGDALLTVTEGDRILEWIDRSCMDSNRKQNFCKQTRDQNLVNEITGRMKRVVLIDSVRKSIIESILVGILLDIALKN